MISAPSVDTIISRLRPRDVSGIIDQAFRLYRKHFLTFLAIVAVVYLPVQLLIQALTLLFIGPVYKLSNSSNTDFTTRRSSQYLNEVFTGLAVYFGALIVLSLLGAVLEYLSQGALTAGVADSQLDRPISLGKSYREMLPRIGSLLGYMGLHVLIFFGIGIVIFLPFVPLVFSNGATGGASLLACLSVCLMLPVIILGIYIYIRLAATVPVIMVEGLGPVQAMRRSWRLVGNYWWRTLGLILLLVVISLIISAGPSFFVSALVQVILPLDPLTRQAVSGVVGVLTSTFFIPLQFTAMTLYYFDLRVRKEGFDIDAAMNQAYPPYGGYGYPQPGYGAYGPGQVAPSPVQDGGQPQANPMYPPVLGYEQQGAGYSYAPATQETVNLGTPPASQSVQPTSEPASVPSSTPYGNDPLGLYPNASGQAPPQEPVSGDIEPGQENTTTPDVDKKGS